MTPNEIFNLLGGPVVLLKVPPGQKRPILKQWQKVTLKQMTPEYLARLNGCNVGVALGAASGGLISIDFDSNDSLKEMLALNPWMNDTLMSRGARGGNVWLAIDGSYPASCDVFTSEKAKICELRATGRQTIISGRHQSGRDYQNNGKTALKVSFDNILWSEAAALPWTPEPAAPPPQPEPKSVHNRIVAKYGKPFQKGLKNSITLNHEYFIRRFVAEHHVIFEQKDERFYFFDSTDGAWHSAHYDVCRKLVRCDFVRMAREEFRNDKLMLKATDATLNAITSGVRVVCGTRDQFKRLPRGLIHCANGMFQLHPTGKVEQFALSPAYFSRNPLPLAYDPNARCLKFTEVLSHALGEDDIDLFQRWFGSCLLTGNAAERFLMMVGDSQTSKTLLLNIVELIIGRHNVTQLRTWMLKERFEIGRYEGKTFLGAKDVAGNFLQHSSAPIIKSLVGHDYIPGELKGGMDEVPIFGDYDLAITSNETLCVRVMSDHDRNAWRRRIMIINFKNKVEKRIVNYDETLVATEGPGILAFAVKGAMLHLKELEESGDFNMTDAQELRVDKLLQESQSARFFVTRCIRRQEGSDLTSEEIAEGYNQYCEQIGWRADAVDVFRRNLPNLMMELYGVQKNTHAERGNGNKKTRRNSYPGVALAKSEDAEAAEPEMDFDA